MKRSRKILLGIVLVVVIIFAAGSFVMMKDVSSQKAVIINSLDVSQLPDGTYSGKYEFSRWVSEVSVEVKDGKITKIESLGPPLIPDISKELFDKIISTQKNDVDVVSGATATSKSYLKAVENALESKK